VSDIIDRIRRVETTPLHATEAWVELWEVLQDARAGITSMLAAGDRLESQLCEVARERDSLRLTDAEREAMEFALDRLRGTLRGNEECDHADTLRGLLERLGGER